MIGLNVLNFRFKLIRQLLLIVMMVVVNASVLFAQRFELVWQDEFDGTSLNTDTWIASFSTAYNNELQFYTNRSQNLRVSDGTLQIIGLRERYQTRNWTSARIRTQGKMDFRYGKVEMRARLPKGKGLWPAFWMLPTDDVYGPWPYSGEIDIMENRGHQMDRFQTTIHYSARAYPGSGNALADRRYIEKETVFSEDSLNAWHTYGLSWDENRLSWLFNGEEVFSIPKTQVEATAGIYPFNQDFHFILNLAIGGNYLGDAQPDASTPDTNRFEIDYIRLYQDVNQSPSVSSLPESDVAVESGSILTLQPTIQDVDGTIDSVKFFLNGVKIAEFLESPYVAEWTASVDGCYTFRVEASDNDGGRSVVESPGKYIVGRGCDRAGFTDTTLSLPGRIELEAFDHGGQHLAYFDTTPFENTGGAFRPFDAVDLSAHPSDTSNFLVDAIQDGEWLEYTVEVTQSGTYDLVLGSVKEDARGRVDVFMDGDAVATFSRLTGDCGELAGPGEPISGARCTVRRGVSLQEGTFILRVFVVSDPGALDFLNVALVSATSTEDVESELPGSDAPISDSSDGIQLSVFPNPFNPSTTIRFTLSEAQPVRWSLHNVTGVRVYEQPERWFTSGVHTVELNASENPSGLYILRVESRTGIWTKNLILLK